MSRSLADIPVLLVDCQTSGATPDKGHLIELGWCLAGGIHTDDTINASLIAPPEETVLPKRVASLTGIDGAALSTAPPSETVWAHLLDTASGTEDVPGVMVAHFAVFERRFVEDLHRRHGHGAFPFDFVCTYELARRLLPDLPRHSLRAVSGYLGFRLPEKRRAREHAAATREIWKHFIETLAARSIVTLDGLRHFLAEPPPKPARRKIHPLSDERRDAVPARPGVYRFLDRDGHVLYVGKATNLRQRVSSYFQGTGKKAPHIREMVAQAYDVETTPTRTALEAALLEVDEIKRVSPEYNRALRETPRPLWFFSRSFESVSKRCDEQHGMGPFPEWEPVAMLATVSRVLVAPAVPSSDVGPTPPGGLPDFLHGISCDAGRAALMWCRAVWFRWLSECQVIWPPTRLKKSVRVITISSATLVGAQSLPRGATPRAVSWRSRTSIERCRGIDRPAYDRLRVLNTELKRLVSEGTPVRVVCPPDRVFEGAALSRALMDA